MGESANNPKWAQRSGPFRERRSKGAQEGWPEGRPEGADFASTRAAFLLRSFGTPSPGWGGANAPYKRFAAGKTLAQAELTSAEHFKIPGPQPGNLPGWARKKCGLKAARRAPQFSKR